GGGRLVNDLDRLAADLTEAGVLAGVKAAKALDDVGRDLRDEARRLAPGARGGRAKHYPKTITHDVTVEPAAVVVEVGPDKNINGQAKLGHIFEYGSVNNAPHAHLGPALDRVSPEFVR